MPDNPLYLFKSEKIASYITLFSMLLFAQCLNAQGYTIDNFKVNVHINQDGSVDIEESIFTDFSSEKRGIIRDIPRKYKDQKNRNINITVSNVSVDNHPYSVNKRNNFTEIKIGDKDVYLKGKQQYDIKYTLSTPFLFLDEHTEFSLNLIQGWDTTIDSSSFKINFYKDPELAFTDYQVVTGQEGEQGKNAVIEKSGFNLIGHSLSSLAKNEIITAYIKLPKDFINRPPPPVSIFKTDRFWYFPLAFLMLFINFFFRSRKENIPEVREPIYFAPDGFSPAEVGAYHDNKVNIEDLIALIPYWAEKGFIKVIGNDVPGNEQDLYFKKLTPLDKESPEYQHIIFDGLFKNSDMILLSELKNKFYSITYNASLKIKSTLLSKQLYDWDHYRIFHTWKNIFAASVLMLGSIALAILSPYKLTAIAIFIIGLCIFVLYFLRPKMSQKGIKLKFHLSSLKKGLLEMNPDKTNEILNTNPRYFEEIYPFAIALGIDNNWMQNIESLNLPAPHWYAYNNYSNGSRTIPLSDFSRDFSVKEIKSVFTSVPASSGSSSGSSFSGGSSGGGFGGGGGRSW